MPVEYGPYSVLSLGGPDHTEAAVQLGWPARKCRRPWAVACPSTTGSRCVGRGGWIRTTDVSCIRALL